MVLCSDSLLHLDFHLGKNEKELKLPSVWKLANQRFQRMVTGC